MLNITSSDPVLSIVVVSYNTREMTLECLRSIVAETRIPYEVIVVDNDSNDGSAEAIAAEFPTFVLMAESQTTGGYPRIGTVIPPDLARIAQAQPGAELRFKFVTLAEGRRLAAAWRAARTALGTRPLVRDPAKMTDLLSHTLIGGVTAGDDLDQES